VSRSRGGRNAKAYVLAAAKGRLAAILPTGGEVHDCPSPSRGPPTCMLGDGRGIPRRARLISDFFENVEYKGRSAPLI